ncbi:MAG: phosphopantothenoylcysteine decarboxylase [Candidatus Omnitrophota bacterium]
MDKRLIAPGRIIVTAGPTIEPIDPVRYISNYSTGTMGYEIAASGVAHGYDVVLISGPVSLIPPEGVSFQRVTTAGEMKAKVTEELDKCDCIIMSAAVCDFSPEKKEEQKIKKKEKLVLTLKKNPDILKEISTREDILKIGFALETENERANGKKKLKEKNLDLIVVNIKTPEKDPFGEGEKDFLFFYKDGGEKEIKKATKRQIAEIIINEIGEMHKK